MGKKDTRRTLTRFDTAEFVPMATFGGSDGAMLWHNISFDAESGTGSYLLVMAPGASSAPHRHRGAEEFYVLEGELVDFDGHAYGAGDFVRLEPGTAHSSLSPTGCKLLVTHWGRTERVSIGELEPLT
ncbi:MAG: cupin domain-containing protein [Albidovulum sp.]|uniref:cupin domain-containing protein n=1 Tax=Albidovulum sp. TaxID=1872424 RepID=UPI003CB3FE53